MYMEINLVTYTHSSCKDIINVHNNLAEKYLSPTNHYIFSDYEVDDNRVQSYIYYDNEPYSEHYVKLLKNINADFFIYHQEDHLLYNKVDIKKINIYLEFLKNNPEYSFVRLLRSGNTHSYKLMDTLFSIETDSDQIFSMQPTIWKKEDLIKIYEYETVNRIRDEAQFKNACKNLNIKGAFHFDNESRRGQNHFDSNIYPCICTALIRGKWNISEYTKELFDIFNEYSIMYNTREYI